MPAKIRLARHGRKRKPHYHIVVTDSRAPRDGRYIERLGLYNPNTNPATIDLDFDRALDWLQMGAQPTETCRAILSYKGVLYKNHLLNGVKKGAFSEEEAGKRFESWLSEKESKIQAKKDRVSTEIESDRKKRLEVETKISEARAAEMARKLQVDDTESIPEETEETARASEVTSEAAAKEVTLQAEEPAAEEPETDTPSAESATEAEEPEVNETEPATSVEDPEKTQEETETTPEESSGAEEESEDEEEKN